MRTPLIQTFELQNSKPRTVGETLSRIRLVLSDKKNWCKQSDFTNARGNMVLDAHQAKRACLRGACELVGGRFRKQAANRLFRVIPKQWFSIEAFNDAPSTRHQHVLEIIDLAIRSRST